MSVPEDIFVDMTVVLGSAQVPIREVLKMGRGAMIALDCDHEDPTLVYVNGELVAKGRILVEGDQMALEVSEIVQRAQG